MAESCPNCKGTSGYTFDMRETHRMVATWEGASEAGDSGGDPVCSMPECIDCGHRFRWSTINAITELRHD